MRPLTLRATSTIRLTLSILIAFSVLTVCFLAVHPNLHSLVHSNCITDDDCAVELFLSGAATTPSPALRAPDASATFEDKIFPAPAARQDNEGFASREAARGPPADPAPRPLPFHFLTSS